MAVRATYAEPGRKTVNLFVDADSVRPGLAIDGPEVVDFIKGGGGIEPYEPPAPPPTLDQIDLRALNEALAAEGSVVRAIAEIQFGMIKGTIPVQPSLTKSAYIALLKARMRT